MSDIYYNDEEYSFENVNLSDLPEFSNLGEELGIKELTAWGVIGVVYMDTVISWTCVATVFTALIIMDNNNSDDFSVTVSGSVDPEKFNSLEETRQYVVGIARTAIADEIRKSPNYIKILNKHELNQYVKDVTDEG